MDADGQPRDASGNGEVLHWPSRVVTAEELRRSLNGQRELSLPARAVVTPLASEYLRTNGIRITQQPTETSPAPTTRWGYVQYRPDSLVRSAVHRLERDGMALTELRVESNTAPERWAREVAEYLSSGKYQGIVALCEQVGVLCCLANKMPGIRAIAVANVMQAAKSLRTLAPNLVAVEMPGPTLFEIRQILRTVCAKDQPACPPELARTLEELDGHAHR